MNEEEKEAIRSAKCEMEIERIGGCLFAKWLSVKDLEVILNLIDKLQKENEELKERNKGLTTALEEWVNGERINDIKHISKDKIRDKIKKYREDIEIFKGIDREEGIAITECKILGLQELLEEE